MVDTLYELIGGRQDRSRRRGIVLQEGAVRSHPQSLF